MTGTALVRRPSSRLAEGIVTHIKRSPIDIGLARRQHDGYVKALADHGWRVREVPPQENCPDSVFIEDTLVICAGTAVITRPGATSRRPETAGVEITVRELGLPVARIEDPGTLDGGDVLQIGRMVYVGLGGRTNAEGIRQLSALLTPLGRTTIAVPLKQVLHLKSAITALPDGTPVSWGGLVDRSLFPTVREVPEESGAHVVSLGGQHLLIAASAPRTAELIAAWGYEPVVVDISEYERLEGCVTCLSVLLPA
jgi:dimethylargininase